MDSSSTASDTTEDDDDMESDSESEEEEEITAKSLMLSPPLPPSPPSPPTRRTACNGVSAAADLSKLTLSDILESQLSAGAEEQEGRVVEDKAGEGEEEESDLQSWLRQIFAARGCDDLDGETTFLSSFLNYMLKGTFFLKQQLFILIKMLMIIILSIPGLSDVHICGDSLLQLLEMVLERYRQLQRLHQLRIDASRSPTPPKQLPRLEAAVLPQLHHLLRRGLHAEAARAAAVILQSDPSAANAVDPATGRTLLTFSAECADRSADLTRLLLSYGAKVCPGREVGCCPEERSENLVADLGRERESSAFTWFLRGAMARCALSDSGGDLSDAEQTVALLGAAMGEEPERMRRHVTRIMLALGRGAALNGALFLQLRLRLSPWWRRPQPLKHQSARRVRRALGPKRLGEEKAVATLGLPEKLKELVRMERPF